MKALKLAAAIFAAAMALMLAACARPEPEITPTEPPVSAAPTETVPTEAVPTETVPTEAVPTETAPTETVPTDAVPTDAVPTETAPTEAPTPQPTESGEVVSFYSPRFEAAYREIIGRKEGPIYEADVLGTTTLD
ncbi:MAG: hypothetical protein J6P98_08610, partial [Clostridia bacterium]|nr:hypothetical protein [Clostridia bacterium]